MNNQVLSIEQMQEFKELGIDTSKASMCWFPKMALDSNRKPFVESHFIDINRINRDAYWNTREGKETIPTFTLQDMLEMLPKIIDKKYFLKMFINCHGKMTLKYDKHPQGDKYCFGEEDCGNLLNAAFNMLKVCKENKYI